VTDTNHTTRKRIQETQCVLHHIHTHKTPRQIHETSCYQTNETLKVVSIALPCKRKKKFKCVPAQKGIYLSTFLRTVTVARQKKIDRRRRFATYYVKKIEYASTFKSCKAPRCITYQTIFMTRW